VADVQWNIEAQMHHFGKGLSNELNDCVTYAERPDNTVDFVNMSSIWNSQIRARAAETMCGRWEGGYKTPDNTDNTTPAPEGSPAGTLAGSHGSAPMDLSALQARQITHEK
jgi:hypothetical protein